ncbi:MAG TPA: dTDP-4-dehydrorhamnose 3,5-epimerase [Pirellulaceae bacterium]|nr:dTDP-4-dehydrorhamnose 3,5-epimerase [Planctomycetales bacterium]HRX80928.1 dTDP-4-dehydrorhamnose 3,5-epimerase [Pirellulaceae bacterium]
MRFQKTKLDGVYLVEPERAEDERGFFARTWCSREAAELSLQRTWVQSSVSFNKRKGTLRGMHYQVAPHAETKLVRCTRGSVFDVVVDLRCGSSTYCQWCGFELSAENGRQLYIPADCAHGFLTLCDDSELCYEISEFYQPGSSTGVRWDDVAFGIDWPAPVKVINPRDATFPPFVPKSAG